MPDMAVKRSYDRRIGGVNRRYLAEIKKALRENRRVMLEILATVGIQSPRLLSLLAREIEKLEQRIVAINQPYKNELVEAGKDQTGRQLKPLEKAGLPTPAVESLDPVVNVSPVTRGLDEPPGWIALYYAGLVSEINRLRAAGETDELATGRLFSERIDDRASVYRKTKNSAMVESDLMVWGVAAGVLGVYLDGVAQSVNYPIMKQAIAAIDERTTDTCLRVHGQIKPLNAPFRLVGTPRFANNISFPPFHWRCRTSTVIYNPVLESVGITTGDMRSAARAEINARVETGRREPIHPSHATSRRRNK